MWDVGKAVEWLASFLPLLGTAAVVTVVLGAAHWLLIARRAELGNEKLFPRQLGMLGLTIACILAIAIALPVTEGTRNQIIGLVGLVLSGIIAFASTTIVANLMAGIMLRVTKPFRAGDFIRVGDYFGRVTERGLLDTEIQTETRELIAIPNTFLITHPVSVVRKSGTIVSTTLSLGYDVHHSQVESLLIRAAEECGLKESFVHVLELGDFTVTYRVCGMLTDVKALITTRSNLCCKVLDVLHGEGIEIMSPAFMNQRRLAADFRVVPAPLKRKPVDNGGVAEEIVFDKAEEAERQEQQRTEMEGTIRELETALAGASGDDWDRIVKQLEYTRERLKAFD